MANCFVWKNWVSFTNGLVKQGGIWHFGPKAKMAPPIATLYVMGEEGTKDCNFLGK
jgi:hypothetical protein